MDSKSDRLNVFVMTLFAIYVFKYIFFNM